MAESDVSTGVDSSVGQAVASLTITSSTTGTVTVPIHGLVKAVLIVAPNLTTDVTFDFQILDSDGDEWYAKDGILDNGDREFYPAEENNYTDIPCVGLTGLKISYTTSQTSTWKIKVRYYNPVNI